jgi:hypothetical protein
MNSYKGFSYPTVREFYAEEEKYTNPDNENQWLYNLGGINILIDKEKGNKEVNEIFRHFIDVVYEDSRKINGAVMDMVNDVSKKNRKVIDAAVQKKAAERAAELEMDLDTLVKAQSYNNDLTEEELQSIADAFNQVKEEHDDLKLIADLPSNNGTVERDKEEAKEDVGEYKNLSVKVNPETGEKGILGDASMLLDDSETFEEMLARLNSEDLEKKEDNSPITEEELTKYLSGENPSADLLINQAIDPESPLSKDAIKKLLVIANRRMNKEEFNVYKEFPEEVQNMVNKYVKQTIGVRAPMNYNVAQANMLRNSVSESLIDSFIANIKMDRIDVDFGKEVEKIFEKGTGEVSEQIVGYSQEKIDSYRKSLETIEDPEKKERLQNILNNIDDAYSLTSLKEFAKKCKIKKFDLEKPKRYYEVFTAKYSNSKYDAFSLNMIKPILIRHLPDYTEQDIEAFLIAFCKQVQNYKSDDILQHSYMYFVTYNIALIDINTSDNTKPVSDKFIDNIKEVIENLKVRNGGRF